MESIESTAKVAIPTLGTSEPPLHVDPEHRRCAFYLNHGQDTIECQHEVAAEGAFYNEDYVNELRIACQKFYTTFSAANAKMTGTQKMWFNRIRELTK